MEKQETLLQNERTFSSKISLQKNPYSLEQEKERFIKNICNLIDPLNFETLQIMGRPKSDFKDVIKSLLIMSYNNMSYRRTQSDLKWMFENELISSIIPRSTLNDYANNLDTKNLIEKLIQASSLFFTDNENTLIVDSTWLATRMYIGGHKRVHDKKNCNFEETRKLHIGILKNSRIIACAKATPGNVHDSPIFKEIIQDVTKNGLKVDTIMADAGYSGKQNFVLCKDLGINEVYIDFKSNAVLKRPKSDIWKEKLKLYKEHHEIWHESYRYRVLIEGVFSAIKRKELNYLRSRTGNAQDVELLLKALTYNITIIGKYI